MAIEGLIGNRVLCGMVWWYACSIAGAGALVKARHHHHFKHCFK
jgi:hypothetical protein